MFVFILLIAMGAWPLASVLENGFGKPSCLSNYALHSSIGQRIKSPASPMSGDHGDVVCRMSNVQQCVDKT